MDRALTTVEALGAGFSSVSQIPNYGDLSPQDKITITNLADAGARGTVAKADGNIAVSLEIMAIEEPERFLQQDLRRYRSQMTPGEFASLQKKAATIRAKPQQEIAFRGAISGTIESFATPEMELSGRENTLRKVRVTAIMETYLRGHVKPGVQPTQPQLMEALRFATGSVGEVKRADMPVFAIPPDHVQAIIRAWRAEHNGATPTDQQVVDHYNRHKARYK